MNIVFAGTPDISAMVLRTLLGTRHKVVAVLTQPDKPSGRGKKITPSPVKVVAQSNGIPIYQPSNLREIDIQETLKGLNPDLILVLAYGLIFPQVILDIPKKGCLNIHTSLLPHYRGSAPVQRAILAGDHTTGISFMKMDAGLDTGPVYAQFQSDIAYNDTTESLLEKMGRQACAELPEFLDALEKDQVTAVPQNDAHASEAKKITKEEALIHWHQSASHIERAIRAFTPWPGAYSFYNNERIRFIRAQSMSVNTGALPGEIITFSREGLDIACGKGILRVQTLQMPGKNPLTIDALINGYSEYFRPGQYFVESSPS